MSKMRVSLLLSTALAATAMSPAAFAAEAPAAPVPQTTGAEDTLGEVVVTATRQSDTVSRVPLTITAVTQRSLDQQGVKNVQDLSRTIPAVTFRRSGNDQVPNVAIRGIIAGSLGGATTGVYLDDVPLQKRGVVGAVTGGGSPFPLLFDLERVEVLKGPQGTLFGASSEGGTVRFITPAPSLTTYSGNVRTEISQTEQGGLSYEAGAALGGPIVEDKLGFRASLWNRHIGGYIDHVSIYDGHTFDKDSNWGDQKVARLAISWKPTERLTITPSYYYSRDYSADLDTWWKDIPAFTVNEGVFTNIQTFNSALDPSRRFIYDLPNKYYPGGSFGPYNQYGPYKVGTGFYIDESHQVLPQRSSRKTELQIPTLTLDFDAGFMDVKSISSYVYDNTSGPVQTGAGLRGGAFSPSGGNFDASGAYVPCAGPTGTRVDSTQPGCTGVGTAGGYNAVVRNADGSIRTQINPISGAVEPVAGAAVLGGFGAAAPFLVGQPFSFTEYQFKNVRRQFTQEIRFSSKPGAGPFSYVAGLYFSRGALRQPGSVLSNENELIYAIRGVDEAFTTFIPNLSGTIFNPGNPPVAQINYTIANQNNPRSTPVVVNGVTTQQPTYDVVQNGKTNPITGTDVSRRLATLDEKEYAAFAELNYMLTSKLKITAGARYSSATTRYSQIQSGPVFNSPIPPFTVFNSKDPNAVVPAGYFLPTAGHPFPNQPGDSYNNFSSGEIKEKPFNPKVGVSYQATDANLFYATMSRGYRSGSVNTPGTLAQCQQDIDALGGPTPLTYNSDRVTNYEVGAKVRGLSNKLQLNASAFYIDWKDPQISVTLRCAFVYVTNGKGAKSQGFEVQGQYRVIQGLTVSFAAGYTDAQYTHDFSFAGPPAANGTPTTIFIVKKGGSLGIPKWQYNLGAQYSFDAFQLPSYVRMDYQYSGVYQRGSAKDTVAYNPVTVKGRQTGYATARAGVSFKSVDISAFVNNVFNSKSLLAEGNGQSSPLRTASSFRPREYGLQASYRF
jgi:outer membrane receptor protein involved in Fe transport